LHHPNTPFKTAKPLSDQPQHPDSASKYDDDKEDDDRPRIFKSPSGRVVTGKDLAFLKQFFCYLLLVIGPPRLLEELNYLLLVIGPPRLPEELILKCFITLLL
jgi:hypothetical protein